MHSFNRFLEARLFFGVQLNLDNAFNTIFTNHHRHTNISALHAILAGEMSSSGQHAAIILEIAFGHGNG